MRATLLVPDRPAAFVAALEGLVRLNERLIMDAAGRGGFPKLYASGVRYKREPEEVWKHVQATLHDGWGDCEDLASWRAAELRVSNEDPGASVITYKSRPRTWHAVVLRGDGRIEDPSRVLGMRATRPGPRTIDDIPHAALSGEEPETMPNQIPIPIEHSPGLCGLLPDNLRGDDDDNEAPGATLINDPEPENEAVTTDAEPEGDGYRGAARIPLATGRAILTASSIKPSPEQASAAALKLASNALNSKAAQMLLPPQAKLALTLLRSPQARAIAKKLGKFAWRRFRRR